MKKIIGGYYIIENMNGGVHITDRNTKVGVMVHNLSLENLSDDDIVGLIMVAYNKALWKNVMLFSTLLNKGRGQLLDSTFSTNVSVPQKLHLLGEFSSIELDTLGRLSNVQVWARMVANKNFIVNFMVFVEDNSTNILKTGKFSCYDRTCGSISPEIVVSICEKIGQPTSISYETVEFMRPKGGFSGCEITHTDIEIMPKSL